MAFDTGNSNDLAQLCLVASDMAYKGTSAQAGDPLAPYFDPVVMAPEYNILDNGFRLLSQYRITTQSVSQVSDAEEIFAQGEAQSTFDDVVYGVNPGEIVSGYGAQARASTSYGFAGPFASNKIVTRSLRGWASIH